MSSRCRATRCPGASSKPRPLHHCIILCCSRGGSFSQWTLISFDLTCFFFIFIFTHPLIKNTSLSLGETSYANSPLPDNRNPPTTFALLSPRSPASFNRSRRRPSSSFPRPGRTALSAFVPASREGLGIWQRSGPGTPTRPSSARPPCNAAARTSCGRRWSFWGREEAESQSLLLLLLTLSLQKHVSV